MFFANGLTLRFFVEGEEQAGWLCLFWNDQNVTIDVLAYSLRFIHCSFNIIKSGVRFFYTFIYAYPEKLLQLQLWEELLRLYDININSQLWLLMGDFNNILSLSEKVGWGVIGIQMFIWRILLFFFFFKKGGLISIPHPTFSLRLRFIGQTTLNNDMMSTFTGIINSCITESQNLDLLSPICDDEIYKAINGIGALNAPGPDGFMRFSIKNVGMSLGLQLLIL